MADMGDGSKANPIFKSILNRILRFLTEPSTPYDDSYKAHTTHLLPNVVMLTAVFAQATSNNQIPVA